jgi:hypothetical protein
MSSQPFTTCVGGRASAVRTKRLTERVGVLSRCLVELGVVERVGEAGRHRPRRRGPLLACGHSASIRRTPAASFSGPVRGFAAGAVPVAFVRALVGEPCLVDADGVELAQRGACLRVHVAVQQVTPRR